MQKLALFSSPLLKNSFILEERKFLEPALGNLEGPYFSGLFDLFDGEHTSQHPVVEILYPSGRSSPYDRNQPRSEQRAKEQYHRPQGKPGNEEVGRRGVKAKPRQREIVRSRQARDQRCDGEGSEEDRRKSPSSVEHGELSSQDSHSVSTKFTTREASW